LPNSFFLPAIAAILVVPISRPTMIGDSELSCSFFGSVTETFVPWFIDMCFSCLLFIKIFYGLRIKILPLAFVLYSSPAVSPDSHRDTCTSPSLIVIVNHDTCLCKGNRGAVISLSLVVSIFISSIDDYGIRSDGCAGRPLCNSSTRPDSYRVRRNEASFMRHNLCHIKEPFFIIALLFLQHSLRLFLACNRL
jgi:hypothetical protein